MGVRLLRRGSERGGVMTKQKLYRVRFKDVANYNHYYLNYDTQAKRWNIDTDLENKVFRTSFTKEELEKEGFGWVFNSPLTEVWELL
jgi:hypothetical protein